MPARDRDASRRSYRKPWQIFFAGLQQLESMQQLLPGVILAHPEYHYYRTGDEPVEHEFIPELGISNPFSHMYFAATKHPVNGGQVSVPGRNHDMRTGVFDYILLVLVADMDCLQGLQQ